MCWSSYLWRKSIFAPTELNKSGLILNEKKNLAWNDSWVGSWRETNEEQPKIPPCWPLGSFEVNLPSVTSPDPVWPVLLLGWGGLCLTHPPHAARSLCLYCFFFVNFSLRCGNSPHSPVVNTPYFHCRGSLFHPWLVKKDATCYLWCGQKNTNKQKQNFDPHVPAPLDITWNCIRGLGE